MQNWKCKRIEYPVQRTNTCSVKSLNLGSESQNLTLAACVSNKKMKWSDVLHQKDLRFQVQAHDKEAAQFPHLQVNVLIFVLQKTAAAKTIQSTTAQIEKIVRSEKISTVCISISSWRQHVAGNWNNVVITMTKWFIQHERPSTTVWFEELTYVQH